VVVLWLSDGGNERAEISRVVFVVAVVRETLEVEGGRRWRRINASGVMMMMIAIEASVYVAVAAVVVVVVIVVADCSNGSCCG